MSLQPLELVVKSPCVSTEKLLKRVKYGGRKGRSAAKRLREGEVQQVVIGLAGTDDSYVLNVRFMVLAPKRTSRKSW